MSIKDHLVALNTFLFHASYHVAIAGPCFGKRHTVCFIKIRSEPQV